MGSLSNSSIIKGLKRQILPNLLHRIFEDLATQDVADNVALIFEENEKTHKHTYAALNNLSNQLARTICRHISQKQLPRNQDGDSIIAICMNPSDKLIITLLAIWKSGAAYLPFDPTFPKSRVEHIIGEAKPTMVIYEEDTEYYDNTFKISFDQLLAESRIMPVNTLGEEECGQYSNSDLAIAMYTSGSTGVPKGCRLLHKNILNRLQWQFQTFPYSKTEQIGVFKTALTFCDSVPEIWGPLMNGLAVLVVPKTTTKDPEKLVDTLEKYQIERLVLVPSLLRSLLMFLKMQNQCALKNLKTWICSGETLPTCLAIEFFDYFPEQHHQLCNFYGSTEIMGDVTYCVMSGKEQVRHHDKVSIGLPLDNTIIYLLDKNLLPVKEGEVGELLVSGFNLAAGYINGRDPEKFIENPFAVDPDYALLYRTGDYARLENGTIMYEGRTDAQIKIRGHRVDLSEVENAVNAIDGVGKAVVLCYKPDDISQALLAFVTTKATLNEHKIYTILSNTLPPYMLPQVIVMESIPLLVNGKIDRQTLLKSYEENNNNGMGCFQVELNYIGVPECQMEAAKVLFETVASVLNRSARSCISIDVNFYGIGGNSLNSIFTITTLNTKGYHISISDFISAVDLREVLDKMSPRKDVQLPIISVQTSCYKAVPLEEKYRKDAIRMVASGFRQLLCEWRFFSKISDTDYEILIDSFWESLIDTGLSFIAQTESGKTVGVTFLLDIRNEPEFEITSNIAHVYEMLHSIEAPVVDKHLSKEKGKNLRSFMMRTNSSLTTKENIHVINFMEGEVIRVAKTNGFEGVMSTNTSPLTQQLGADVYGYQTLHNTQMNLYTKSDGTRPFGMALDTQMVTVQYKRV